ncbi:MAG: hypothetical protein R3B91_16210 [Planctomycetaceae bacterium]
MHASQREIAATLQAIQSADEETSISFKTDDDGYIVQFSARGQSFDRTDAEILEGLTTLEHLELADTAIIDESLNSIGKLHRLSTAILDNTQYLCGSHGIDGSGTAPASVTGELSCLRRRC